MFREAHKMRSKNSEVHNILMLLTKAQQENIIAHFGRLQVKNTLKRSQEANIIAPFWVLRIN